MNSSSLYCHPNSGVNSECTNFEVHELWHSVAQMCTVEETVGQCVYTTHCLLTSAGCSLPLRSVFTSHLLMSFFTSHLPQKEAQAQRASYPLALQRQTVGTAVAVAHSQLKRADSRRSEAHRLMSDLVLVFASVNRCQSSSTIRQITAHRCLGSCVFICVSRASSALQCYEETSSGALHCRCCCCHFC